MSIPLIPAIPTEFLQILPSGKVVIFLGAGVSRLMGHPSWNELADRSFKYLIETNNFSHADFDVLKRLNPRQKLSIAVDIYKSKGHDPKVLIREAIKAQGEAYPRVFELLGDISVPFVTTNYDDCLLDVAQSKPILSTQQGDMAGEQNLNSKRQKPVSEKAKILTTLLTANDIVIYLHGRLADDSQLVISTKDYVEHYRDDVVREFLDHLFENYHVLFIGYGLEEEEIIDFIVRKKPAHKEISHFRLIPAFSHEEKLMEHLGNYYSNQCQVRLVPYLIDSIGHRQLEIVLEAWLPTIKAKFQPVNFIEKTRMILDPVIKNDSNS